MALHSPILLLSKGNDSQTGIHYSGPPLKRRRQLQGPHFSKAPSGNYCNKKDDWWPIPFYFQTAPSLVLHMHHPCEEVLLKEAVTPASSEQQQYFFPELTDLLYVNLFLITACLRPTSLCCPLVAGPPAREALGAERPLRSSSPITLYCRQMHYISRLINVINLVCKNSLG